MITVAVIHYVSLTQWLIYGEWAYECNSSPIRKDRKSDRQTFVGVRKHSRSSRGVANNRNILLKFARKA